MYEDFLPLVTKPARYINTEINAVHKDLSKVRTRVCLLFPDAYEVGMSHLGLRILYHILNGREDTACERVFSPWTDYEERLRASDRPLASLESNLPLSQFDIIGVTLQYELSYTNILTALNLARIPVRSAERKDGHPVVIAGGPCAVNPEPLSEFIDVFCIGEAEDAVHEIVELRLKHASREKFLHALAEQEGFYVPALGKKGVRRRFVQDIESAPYPDKPILPLMKPVHDRANVEIARGCIRGCRFCQAGVIYRPYRERSPERIQSLLLESLRCTGYEELSLLSLSAGDFSDIRSLVQKLMERYRENRVSISLPSLRVGTLTPEMVRAIAGVRKTGFTLAPEAGTERLRRVINKPVSDQDLMDAAETIFTNGWNVLKLYFMIGLPTETEEDLDGIIRLVQDLFSLGKRVSKRPVQLNVSVSSFVPKPHTPFQWLGQAPLEDIRAKQAYLEKGLKRRRLNLKFHNPEMGLLEAVFARGDSALSRVVEEAVNLGCRFDGWAEHFRFAAWTEAFRKHGLDPTSYAYRRFELDEPLPWGHVLTGVTGEFLEREYRRALAAEVTENCRVQCESCGMGCGDGGTAALGKPAPRAEPIERKEPLGKAASPPKHAAPQAPTKSGQDLTVRIRMKYTKTGRLRFLSHLDLMTLFQRAAARAGIPVAFSQGFNPHPRIAFGPALSVGMESEAEYLDMETDPFIDLLQTTKGLNKTLPQGVRIVEACVIPKKAPSLSGSISRYVYEMEIPAGYAENMEAAVRGFLSRPSVIVTKDGKQKDIKPGIESIAVKRSDRAERLEITLLDSEQVKPRVQEILERMFGIGPEQSALFRIKRTAQYGKDKGKWASPMDVK